MNLLIRCLVTRCAELTTGRASPFSINIILKTPKECKFMKDRSHAKQHVRILTSSKVTPNSFILAIALCCRSSNTGSTVFFFAAGAFFLVDEEHGSSAFLCGRSLARSSALMSSVTRSGLRESTRGATTTEARRTGCSKRETEKAVLSFVVSSQACVFAYPF